MGTLTGTPGGLRTAAPGGPPAVAPGGPLAVSPAGLLDAARRVVEVLSASAVRSGSRSGSASGGLATWVTACPTAGPRALHAGGIPTLYDGDAGIGLACAVLAGPLGDDGLAELGVAAVRNAVRRAPTVPSPGLYDGRAGIALAALRVGALLDQPALRAAGVSLLRGCPVPASPDLVSGAAGVLLALRAGYELGGAADLLDRADDVARRLVTSAHRGPVGCHWPAPGERRGLCGLAHGNSGVALALASCGEVDAVRDALRWERAWFDARRPGWPDLRSDPWPDLSPRSDGESNRPAGHGGYPALWCHGAAGIGLARLLLHDVGALPTGERPGLLAEAGAALHAVRAALSPDTAGGLTLCHGAGGPLELLLLAHELLGDEGLLDTARRHAARLLGQLGDDPDSWPSGHPTGGWSAGLLCGLAGTAWTLARLALPEIVPSPAVPFRLTCGDARGTRTPGRVA